MAEPSADDIVAELQALQKHGTYTVRLAASVWIKFLSVLVAHTVVIVGLFWQFAMDTKNRLAILEEQSRHMRESIIELKTEIREWTRGK